MSKRRLMITVAFAGTSLLAVATAQAQGGSPTGTGTPGGGSTVPGMPGDTTTSMQPSPLGTGSTGTTGTDSTGTTGTGSTGRTGTGTDITGTSGTSGTDTTPVTPTPGTPGSTGTDSTGTLGPRGANDESNVDIDVTPPAEPAPPVENQIEINPAPAAVPVQPIAADTPAPRRTVFNRVGGALLVGGGVEDFTSNNVQSMTSVGGFWNARAIAGTRQFVGLEAAYVGAAHSIDALGLSSNAALVSNGVEGALRLNVPVLAERSMFEPFGFIGLGWQHYSLTNTSTSSADVANSDDIMTMPLGGGLEYAYGPFIADARFTYRYTYRNDLMRTQGGTLNNWGVGGQVGFAF